MTIEEFMEMLKEENPSEIAKTDLDILIKSEDAVKNLSSVIDVFDMLDDLEGDSNKETLEENISEKWITLKKDRKLQSTEEFDKIIIESMFDIFKGGDKK